jgi:hypothetical protein
MFGIGVPEILLLAILGGGFVAWLLVILFHVRRIGGGRVAELEAENRRLREQLDRRG